MPDQLIVHDRVSRSSTRFSSLAICRWNPVIKQIEGWSIAKHCWQIRNFLTMKICISNKIRMVKWISTWAEPTEDCES